MVQVEFKRGERSMLYKQSFGGPSIILYFLNHKTFKTAIQKPKCKQHPRGISAVRKQTIINKLGPIFPCNRLHFWKNLASTENEKSDDSE